jgi:hypothetical protein
MLRLSTFFGVLMLVLFVWAGSSAHAAERIECIPVSSEGPGHFEGDRDEAPTRGENSASHHHSGCNGHQFAASVDMLVPLVSLIRAPVAGLWIERYAASREPDRQLRPPIA